jgi:hypothetical protein
MYRLRIVILTLALLLLFTLNLLNAQNAKPDWVSQHPVNSSYYIGVGSASKDDHPTDYRQIAKDNALRDLSSEITVNISSEFVMSLSEKSGMLAEEVQSQVRSSTQANLEGFEQAGAWENDLEYWVYYRLSKAEYAMRREDRKQKAINLSRDMFTGARVKAQEQDIASAFTFYVQAMSHLEEFLGESIQVDYNGQSIYLQNEIFSALQGLVSKMEFTSQETKLTVKIGQPFRTPLSVKATYRDANGQTRMLAALPVRFSFSKGAGNLLEHAQTDMNGAAYCQVSAITSTDKLQIIKAQPDIAVAGHENTTPLTQSILRKLSLPEVKYILTVSGLSIYFQAEETHLGQKLSILYIEPQFKNALAAQGYGFTEDPAQADLMIELKAASRQGAEVFDLFSAFVDLTVSVTDLSTGTEIYKESLNGIKSVQLDYDKAGIEALKKAGKAALDIIPKVNQKIQN